MRERVLNGFEIGARGWFFWLNAYGFGVGRRGRVEEGPWQFIVYRRGCRLVRG